MKRITNGETLANRLCGMALCAMPVEPGSWTTTEWMEFALSITAALQAMGGYGVEDYRAVRQQILDRDTSILNTPANVIAANTADIIAAIDANNRG